MNHVFLILGAVLAPFAIHEAGHWALSRIWGIPLIWRRSGWRLVWAIHAGATPTESVVRQIAIAGFWTEVLGAVAIVAAAGTLHALRFPAAAYAGVAMGHLWNYAVLGRDPAFDDFSLLRRCGGCGDHDS